MEYIIKESNGKYYVQQFDDRRKQTAHAKLDNLRQTMLWIEEKENRNMENVENVIYTTYYI